jgi:hypothetical protein
MNTDTNFFAKRPALRVFVDILFKRLEIIITNAVTAGVVILITHHNTHNQIWQEAGPHMQANVEHIQNLELSKYGKVLTDSNVETNIKEKETK